MSETTSRIIKIATKKRYKNKYHWTDYFSYFYLFLGVLLMFGPVIIPVTLLSVLTCYERTVFLSFNLRIP